MTDEVADHRAVLLLDPGLVVLAVRPRTGELDAPLGAVLGESIVDESFVDEYAVVVRVDAFDVDAFDVDAFDVDAFDREGQLAVRWPPVLCSIRASVDV